MFRFLRVFVVAIVAVGGGWPVNASFARQRSLATRGQAEAVIVVGREAGEFQRWIAEELQRYVRQLSGAELPVVTSDKLPNDKSLLVLGSPTTNPLVAAAQEQRLVDFAGLKPEGLILKTVELDGRSAAIIGGNDEAGTMYAAYELLERLGIVFQLTNDVVPHRKPDLAMPALDVRLEPQMKYRGMHCCHGLRWYMGLEDFRKHIDQLAKLKMNCLQFYFGIGGSPWLKFSYKGKKTEILYPKESGYLAWGGEQMLDTSGTANDVRVGRECFPTEFLGAPEFADVETQDEAYRTARQFLQEVIRYAHRRKVQVWLMIGEIPRVPANMVPPDVKTSPNLFYCGRLMPGGHTHLVPIWEAAVASLLDSYPEADAIGFWCSEGSARADDPETQRILSEHAEARKLIPELEEITRLGNTHAASRQSGMGKNGSVLDSDFAEICVANEVVRAVKARHPDVNLVVSVLFRGYLLRAMDALLPKDVRLQNMDTYANSKPVMHFYGAMEGRELVVMPRIDHDGCELHMQLNITQYEEDEIVSGAAKFGLAGIVGQLNKERGLEVNARYIAEGAWNPAIASQTFCKDYLGRVFGPEAADMLAVAYLHLDKSLGFRVIGNGEIFTGWTRFRPFALNRSRYSSSSPDARLRWAQQRQAFWRQNAEQGRRGLAMLREATPKVLPGARDEFEYVLYKVQNFNAHMEVAATLLEANGDYARAMAANAAGDTAKFRNELEQCRTTLDRAEGLAREAACQMIPYCNIPTEKYLLFRYNQNVIGSIEADQKYLALVLRNAATPPAIIAHWTFDSARGSTVPFTGDVGGSPLTFQGALTGSGRIDTDGGALIGAGAYLGTNDPDNDSGITLARTTVGSDGTTRLDDQLDLAGVSGMTFSTWVKSSRAREYGTLFHGYGGATHTGYGVQTWPNSGQPRYHPGWSEDPYYDNGNPGPPNLMDGDWHHLVVTLDGTAVRFYVDGKTQTHWKRTQTAISQGSHTGDRFIGHHADTGYDSQIVGYLDDMGIWKNKVLSATDVALLHGFGRVQGSDLAWLDEAAALWAGDVGDRATIDDVAWEKVQELKGAPCDWGGSKNRRDGYIILEHPGDGIRMVAPKTGGAEG